MTTSIVKTNSRMTPARSLGSWMDQLFEDNLNRFFDDSSWGFKGINQQVNVPVNLRETDKTFEMSLIAPGLRKEDLKLNITDNLLTVSYEQKEEKNDGSEGNGWLRKEYKMQSFSRSFNLDDSIDAAKISASYDNGVLHLTLPKKESSRRISKVIEVK